MTEAVVISYHLDSKSFPFPTIPYFNVFFLSYFNVLKIESTLSVYTSFQSPLWLTQNFNVLPRSPNPLTVSHQLLLHIFFSLPSNLSVSHSSPFSMLLFSFSFLSWSSLLLNKITPPQVSPNIPHIPFRNLRNHPISLFLSNSQHWKCSHVLLFAFFSICLCCRFG